MKKIFFIIIFTFCSIFQSNPERIIGEGEIASWIIQSELIIIGTVLKVEPVIYKITKTKQSNGYYFECEKGREKYYIKIDSLIKGEYFYDTLTVYTPVTCVSHRNYKEEKVFKEIDEKGDSTFMIMVSCYEDYYDDSWFRLKNGEKRIILLDKEQDKYEVLFRMDSNKNNYNFIDTVNVYGLDYMKRLFPKEKTK